MKNSLNEELLKVVPNRFLLAIAAAKRSRQLADGSKSLTGFNDETVVLTALNEINEGKVEVNLRAEDLLEQPVRTKKAVALETAPVAEPKDTAKSDKPAAKKVKKEEKTSSKDKKKKSVVA